MYDCMYSVQKHDCQLQIKTMEAILANYLVNNLQHKDQELVQLQKKLIA